MNNGKVKWTNPSYLKPIIGIIGNVVKISSSIFSQESITITIEFFTDKLRVGEFCSRWGMHDCNDNRFGEYFEFIIKIKPKSPCLSSENHKYFPLLKKYRESYQVEKMSDDELLRTLEKSNGDLDQAISYLDQI